MSGPGIEKVSGGGWGRWEMDELRLVVGAMVILSLATGLLVVMPYLLLKNVPPPAGLKPYTSVQLQGRQVYIANGCVYCHSQQPRDIAQALRRACRPAHQPT